MQNPWHYLPTDFPYILPQDNEWVAAYNSQLQKSADKKTGLQKEQLLRHHALRTDITPFPYYGDPEQATVIVLQANPGYDPLWQQNTLSDQILELDRKNLLHENQIPLCYSHPDIAYWSYNDGKAAQDWYWQRTRELREAVGWENVAQKLMYMELFPYRSIKLKYPKTLPPSQEYTFYLLKQALERDVWIILTRMEKQWLQSVPELQNYAKIVRLRSKQNVTLSQGNMNEQSFIDISAALKSNKTKVHKLKPFNIKNHINAGLTTLIPNLNTIVAPFLERYPHWQMGFQLAIGAYGYFMALKQEEVNEYVEFIKDHPHEFREEIVSSKEFSNGFLTLFEEFLKARTSRKKDLLKSILLGFARSENMNNFEVERLSDTVLKLSAEGIEGLRIIQEHIMPIKKQRFDEQAQLRMKKDGGFVLKWKDFPLPKYAKEYFSTYYGDESEIARKRHDFPTDMSAEQKSDLRNEKDAVEDMFYNSLDELISLGIVKTAVSKGGDGMSLTGGTTWDLSSFGYDLLEYIVNSPD